MQSIHGRRDCQIQPAEENARYVSRIVKGRILRRTHLKREQILNQILLFLVSKVQTETRIVVVDDLAQVLESPIVKEASLLMREEASQGCVR